MQPRWFLSQFFTDPATGLDLPVCMAYGGQWFCPTLPSTPTGSALVQMLCNSHQMDAAGQDPRVVVCPVVYDPSPLPSAVTDAYTSWGGTAGMSMGALLAKLAESEPTFSNVL